MTWWRRSFPRLFVHDGLVTEPSITFDQDTSLGIWRSAKDTLAVTARGVSLLTVGTTGSSFSGSGQVLFSAGTAALPGIAIVQTNLGFTSLTTNQIRFVSGGNSKIEFGNDNVLGMETNHLFAWTNTSNNPNTTRDLFLGRAAAANLRMGALAANPPVAQTLSMQNASGTDIAGVAFTIDACQGTGTGAGGSVIIRTAAAGSTGSSLNALTEVLTIASTGTITSSRPTGGIGYATGAGGTVTQLTDKATGVTLNTVTGEITMNGAALAGDTAVTFTLTNSAIAAADHMMISHDSAGTAGSYNVVATSAAGSSAITVRNVTTGSLSEAIVLKYTVFKSATA